MKGSTVLLTLIIIALTTYYFLKLTNNEPSYSNCKIRLNSISKKSGYAGESIFLYGKWRNEQGDKLIGMNNGRLNKITAVSWSDTVIEIKIPDDFLSDEYKIGIYCNNPHDPKKGGSYSSGWLDFYLVNKN